MAMSNARQDLPSNGGAAAQAYPADLLAKRLIITAKPADRLIYVSAVCENLGPGRAKGPFTIAISVDLTRGGVLTSYVQSFVVPSDVSLAGGPPVFEMAMSAERAFPGPGIGSIWQTTYVTPAMEVPLHYRDDNPSATYTAEFLVDADFQVSDPDRANNYYTWPGTFWFTSPDARGRKSPFVVERRLAGQAG